RSCRNALRLANKLIEVRIRSAFAEHISRSMAPLGVSVSVTDEKVTLDGISCSGGLRQRAAAIARAVAGDNRIVSVPSRGRLWATSRASSSRPEARRPSPDRLHD